MPHVPPLLNDLLVLLLASIPIAFLFNRLGLPVIVGFMITGVLIGPYGFKLITDVEAVDALAEIGVVLLLFAIGLEFSLRRILEMRRLVFGGGGLQVGLTALVTFAVAYLIGRTVGQSVFYGFLFALSSTAIVLKSFMDRAEIDSPHGRGGVGILLFQDLCVVPMMLMVPVLSGREGSAPATIILRLLTALAA
ncbi:MAG TPA: cation:proton antiporter, partial [Blastocatellia bacterium]|nr:cation:proton antiporter [Blastocatellia bacterium]